MTDELALAPAHGLRVLWDRPAVMAYPREDGEPKPAWRLEGSLDPDYSTLRVLSAATDDGSLLLLAAARRTGSAAHDEEAVAALITDENGIPEPIEQGLISTEYGSDGSVQRVGLELYKAGADYPLRGAGDATGSVGEERDGVRHDLARLSFRLDGREGTALYEILTRV